MLQLRPDTAKNKCFFKKKIYYKATGIQAGQYQNKDRNRLMKKKGVFRNKPIYIIYIWASLVAQTVKNLPVNAEDLGSIPGLGRSPGEGNGNPLQYSCLGNPVDSGARQATVRGVAKGLDTI